MRGLQLNTRDGDTNAQGAGMFRVVEVGAGVLYLLLTD